MTPSDVPNDVVLSVIVPAYNEEPVVRQSIERLREVPLKLEIIVVNDGSADRTGEILDALAKKELVDVVIHQPNNTGKGSAIRAGLARATGDLVVVQDADLEYDPMELRRLMEPIVQGKADAVYGSRFQSGPRRVLYFWHSIGNRLLTLISNMLTNLNLTDVETCYKMIRRDLAQSLPLVSDRFGIEVELTARLARAGARIWEIPISYNGRTYAEGKKIGWRDGLAALWHILRFNLFPPAPPDAARR
jgi:glycosyltransferase involved in cell wall biosynthesis